MEKEKRLTFRVEQEILTHVKNIATHHQVSVGCLIRTALKKFIEDYDRKRDKPD